MVMLGTGRQTYAAEVGAQMHSQLLFNQGARLFHGERRCLQNWRLHVEEATAATSYATPTSQLKGSATYTQDPMLPKPLLENMEYSSTMLCVIHFLAGTPTAQQQKSSPDEDLIQIKNTDVKGRGRVWYST